MSPIDNETSIIARVSVLEDWRHENRDWMVEMRSAITAMTASIQTLRLCASPNACVALRSEIDEMAQDNKNAMRRIESLEKWRTFISGVTATVCVVWLVMQVILPWMLKGVVGP